MPERVSAFLGNRWLVFVCAMWVQSFAGIAYMFGSISPVIKSNMGYNQRQLALLGTAKDLGDNIGLLAGKLSEVSPTCGVLLAGAAHICFGYGIIWLTVTHRLPPLPLWMMCIFIYIGTNGTPYYNTATLVSCVQNFPKNRGPVVGILKGFVGLSGAIMTQIVYIIHTPDNTSLIFLIAVGTPMVAVSLMFVVRPVEGHTQERPSDKSSFFFIYSICILLAAFLMGVLMLENLVDLDQKIISLFAVTLLILLLLPIIVPITLFFFMEPSPTTAEEKTPFLETSAPETLKQEDDNGVDDVDGKKDRTATLSEPVGAKEVVCFEETPIQRALRAWMKLKHRERPSLGEDFTFIQALMTVDLWLVFFSLVLGGGSGLTIINNLGQICQSLGYNNPNIFVSMMSICNFLGRVGGGYFSEVITRRYGYPRPISFSMVQIMMAIGLLYYAMGWSGQVYVVTILIGLGYGAHWAIGVASISELFGLKSFGALYNFLTMSMPAGTLFLSGLIASNIYDYFAENQAEHRFHSDSNAMAHPDDPKVLTCEGNLCFSITCAILSASCLLASILSLAVVRRTKGLYSKLREKSSELN